MESEFNFPKKPATAKQVGKQLGVSSNYFGFKISNPKEENKGSEFPIHKYTVDFTPEIPDDSKLRAKLVRSLRDKIEEKIEHTIFKNLVLYSLVKSTEPFTMQTKLEGDETEYSVEFKHVQ
jgi:aubergine-like protein